MYRKLNSSGPYNQNGQALIEVALLLPFLVLLLLGVIELGRFGYIDILVGNAARAGTGYGAQSLPQSADQSGITNAAQNDFQNNGQPRANLSVDAPVVACGCDSGGSITSRLCVGTSAGSPAGSCTSGHWVVDLTVTTRGTFTSIFTYPGIPSSVTFVKSSSMRVRAI